MILSGLRRGLRRFSGGGSGSGFAAVEGLLPSPALRALRRSRVGRRRVTRGATTLFGFPIMGRRGAVRSFGRSGSRSRSALGQAAVLGFPSTIFLIRKDVEKELELERT